MEKEIENELKERIYLFAGDIAKMALDYDLQDNFLEQKKQMKNRYTEFTKWFNKNYCRKFKI